MKIAVLDDYQNVALKFADWSTLAKRVEITVFNDHVFDPSAVVERLRPFDVVCVMRERTPLQHPFRVLDNVLATPHIGYVTENLYRAFYEDVVANIAAWLDTQSTAKATSSPTG